MEYQLHITPAPVGEQVELRLVDEAGRQLGDHCADLGALTASQRRALFDLRTHLNYYVPEQEHAAELARLGVLIAEQLLGEESFLALWRPLSQRTLQVQLPAAGAAALVEWLARVPWELARPDERQAALGERHLEVRVVHGGPRPQGEPLAGAGVLKVLLVFAEAPGARPLAMQAERKALLQLFREEIYPQRQVEVTVLAHGVTRERLRGEWAAAGGFHLLHWSGHGQLDELELMDSAGGRDRLKGAELLELCGGWLPRLVVLSACHSGAVAVRDWEGFRAAAAGEGVREIETGEAPTGLAGSAHALLEGGVPSVVAMRYAVGDDYARLLALELYRALLAHPEPKEVAEALSLARDRLRASPERRRFTAADGVTPVLFGSAAGLRPAAGRSRLAGRQPRQLPRLAELQPPPHFVGRSGPLAQLGAHFIGVMGGGSQRPVAQLTGLGGMGKTALAAEVIEQWGERFDWIVPFQSRPQALAFDEWLRQLHLRLVGELGVYQRHIEDHPADALYREPSAGFSGEARHERLTDNLLRALQDEALLLVLDNFESQLQGWEVTAGGGYACQEPAWERCLGRLSRELPGSRSRLLITSRQPLAALAEAGLPVALGPLPAAEAALFVRLQPTLADWIFSERAEERALAERLLAASRFHPLLLDRLARLAGAGPRASLLAALAALEAGEASARLPELFAGAGGAAERAYLEEALAGSIDRLLAEVGPEARRLLWMVGVADEAVAEGLLRGVWGGESLEQGQLRQVQSLLTRLEELPEEAQEQLKGLLPPELRAAIAALPPPSYPDPDPLLQRLLAVGLLSAEGAAPQRWLSGHELVWERLRAWQAARPAEGAAWAEPPLRLAYAERLVAQFAALLHQDREAALAAGSRALVHCVKAKAWERLGEFASTLVTSTGDPQRLQALLPYLRAAAAAAPAGRDRWRCLTYLADGLRRSGHPDQALASYAEAAALAQAATAAGGEAARQAWADLAWISGNWALALGDTGDLAAARQRLLESAEFMRQAGRSAADILLSELEALRIDIWQGQVEQAQPEVERRLAQLQGWWQRQAAGERLAEAPDREVLARTLLGALDIAKEAHVAREAWAAALAPLDSSLALQQALGRPAQDIAATRANRANVLVELGRLTEAQAELEACLEPFRADPAGTARVLGSLAAVFYARGDGPQALAQQRRALALCNQLPDPRDRAISHHNLANYLERYAGPAERAAAPHHQLAALVYHLVADLRQDLQTSLGNYAVRFRRAHAAGTPLAIPRLAELLAEPAFEPLARWLTQRGIEVAPLQTEIDERLERLRQATLTPQAPDPQT